MPHPMVWRKHLHQRKITVTRETAIEFLSNHRKLNPELAIVFAEWMVDLEDIAGG